MLTRSHLAIVLPLTVGILQKDQEQARAGITLGSGAQHRRNDALPQWQIPSMTMTDTPDANAWALRIQAISRHALSLPGR